MILRTMIEQIVSAEERDARESPGAMIRHPPGRDPRGLDEVEQRPAEQQEAVDVRDRRRMERAARDRRPVGRG